VWPHNPETGFRPPSATVVSAEPFSHGTGTLRCLQKEMATHRHWSVSLWRDPDDVPHCRILSPDKTEWRFISATLCGWRRCFVADQLWFNTHTRIRSIVSVNSTIRRAQSSVISYFRFRFYKVVWSLPFIVGLCECILGGWHKALLLYIIYGLESMAPISGPTRLLALQKNGFTVNWVKGSSLNDDVTGRQPMKSFNCDGRTLNDAL